MKLQDRFRAFRGAVNATVKKRLQTCLLRSITWPWSVHTRGRYTCMEGLRAV